MTQQAMTVYLEGYAMSFDDIIIYFSDWLWLCKVDSALIFFKHTKYYNNYDLTNLSYCDILSLFQWPSLNKTVYMILIVNNFFVLNSL